MKADQESPPHPVTRSQPLRFPDNRRVEGLVLEVRLDTQEVLYPVHHEQPAAVLPMPPRDTDGEETETP